MALTTTRLFQSTDASAPVLTGQTGSLIALLHACLVGTSGVAYGSGGTAKTAAGWSEPFTNTSSKGVWRNSLAAGGIGCYYRVLDDASGAGGAKEAFTRTYATMSDIDTGTNATPSVAQLASGSVMRKSGTADSTARRWVVIADERTVYLWTEPSTAVAYAVSFGGGGDFTSEVAGDGFAFFNAGEVAINSTYSSSDWLGSVSYYASNSATTAGLWAGTGYAQTGAPVGMGSFAIGPSGVVGGEGLMANPAAGSAKNYYIPMLVKAEGMIRGQLRGIYYPLNTRTANPSKTIDVGIDGLPVGSAIMLLAIGVNTLMGAVGVETALSW